MDSEIVNDKPFTNEETKLLLDLIESSKIITSKRFYATATNSTPVDQNVMTPHKFKRRTLSTPRAVKKKFKPDESRIARDTAIAEYYSAKKQFINECIELKNRELKLKNEKLLLETEKLKLELEKLKKP